MAGRAVKSNPLFSPEQELSEVVARLCRVAPTDPEAAAIADALRSGRDPLGDALISARSPEHRRASGAVYTPHKIVNSMIAWAQHAGMPQRVVDPGAGSGRFLLAAARAFPEAQLIAIEPDSSAVDILRANVKISGIGDRATILQDDYRAAKLPAIDGQTLFIGNPPYVRHHDIEPSWKAWFTRSARNFGQPASQLAGLHIYFFLRTLQLARAGDYGAFITSAEWLDVNYGSVLRNLLASQLGGTSLHVIDPRARPFPDAATTGAITCFRVHQRPTHFRVQTVDTLDDLNSLSRGETVPWGQAAMEKRWSAIIRPRKEPSGEYVELGELCRVHRGQVTGNNEIWIAGEHAKHLPASVLFPAVTKARELIEAVDQLTHADRLRQVIDIPADLDVLGEDDLRAVKKFLAWAKLSGGADGYIAQHRRAWWEVRLKEPAPIMCTYMARRPPAFVRNLCGARHINVAHGLYPLQPISDRAIANLTAYLRANVSTDSGRTYAGGLTKFEPRELERVRVPTLEMLETA